MNRVIANIGALALSLVLAIAVWVVAVQDENPVITEDLETPVPVTLIGPDAGLSIVGQPVRQVVLEVRAPRRLWDERLRAQDFVVEADLSDLGPGRHTVPLTASYPSEDVEIADIKPDSVVVNLEAIVTRRVDVQAELLGEPAFGYEWRTTYITPTEISVTGPATIVDQVRSAVVEVALPGVRSTVERLQPVALRDQQGNTVTGISDVEPRSVQVLVEIAQRAGYRDYSVRVPTTGTVALGYQITGIEVQPSLVTLRGSPDAFDQLPGYVETTPIALDGITEDIRARLTLDLPETLAAVGLQGVSVHILVDPIFGSRSFQAIPVIRGLAPGLTRTISLRLVDLVVTGPLPVLEQLNDANVQVLADLSGLEPGVHSVRLMTVVPEGVTVVSLLPEQIDITISEIATPAGTSVPVDNAEPPATLPTSTP